MQLVQEVTQSVMNSYIGGEIILSNEENSHHSIVRGTITKTSVIDAYVSVSLTCEGWAHGVLDDNVETLEWEELNSASVVILGSSLTVGEDGVATFTPSIKGTVARVALPIPPQQLQPA